MNKTNKSKTQEDRMPETRHRLAWAVAALCMTGLLAWPIGALAQLGGLLPPTPTPTPTTTGSTGQGGAAAVQATILGVLRTATSNTLAATAPPPSTTGADNQDHFI